LLIFSSNESFHPSRLNTLLGQPKNSSHLDTSVRKSSSATTKLDNVLRCVKARAASFQGFDQSGKLEALQVVKYGLTDEYKHHYDWFQAQPENSIRWLPNRETTFFVYLEANCTGGGTNFPRLQAPRDVSFDDKWCQFIDCDQPYHMGVTFKPIIGNAVFWQNMKPDGEGHRDTLHAGLPVTSGQKVGLNIWTKQLPRK
jgi:prolyl 4-hydroxylase